MSVARVGGSNLETYARVVKPILKISRLTSLATPGNRRAAAIARGVNRANCAFSSRVGGIRTSTIGLAPRSGESRNEGRILHV